MSDRKLLPRRNAARHPHAGRRAGSRPDHRGHRAQSGCLGTAGFSAEGADLTEQPFLYARWTNPATRALEERFAGLEGPRMRWPQRRVFPPLQPSS